MVSFLTTCKAFSGPVGRLQVRALENWLTVCPGAEVLIFGRSEGLEGAVAGLQGVHVHDVRVSDAGMPFFDALADQARLDARHDIQVYVNADILFPPDFGYFLERVPEVPFLLVGQRVDLFEQSHFDCGDYYASLGRALVYQEAEVHRPSGMDYFVFRRGLWRGLKPLVVGRGGYDNALVTYGLRAGIPVIDASFAFPVVHQWHDYGHVKGGQPVAHYGPEAVSNMATHGLRRFAPNCVDADYTMERTGNIVRNVRRSLLRKMEAEFYYRRGWTWLPHVNQMWHLLTRGGRCLANPDWRGKHV